MAASGRIRRFIFLGAPGVGKGTFASLIAPQMGLTVVSAGDLIRQELKLLQEEPPRDAQPGDSPGSVDLPREHDRKAEGFSLDATPHLTRDELRALVARGGLLPDAVVVPLVLSALPTDPEAGFILDGFPRTVSQAEALESALGRDKNVQRVMNIMLEESVAVAKVLGRVTCPKCNRGFNTAHIVGQGYDMPAIPPPAHGECPSRPAPTASPPLREAYDCPAERGELVKRSDDNEETAKRRMEVYRKSTAPLLGYYRTRGILVDFWVRKGIKDTPELTQLMQKADVE